MRIIRQFNAIPDECMGAVLALGNFDGLHAGHQAIISEVKRLAADYSTPAAVMTFEPHPRRLFNSSLPPFRIVPFHEKARLLREAGIDALFVAHFTPAFSQLTAQEFIENLLVKALAVRHVVVGRDFYFGHNREGTAEFLQQQSQALGFGFTQLDGVIRAGEPCSSSGVRVALEEGNMRLAAELLGRAYSISGRVVHGHERGRTIGFPTANIIPHGIFHPKHGVYAVQIAAGGKALHGVANFGKRPTFQGTETVLEVHCFDCNHSLYGSRLQVRFVEYLRPEQAFDGVEALKAQIERDAARAKQVLGFAAKV